MVVHAKNSIGFFTLNTLTGLTVTGAAATACWFYRIWSRDGKKSVIRKDPNCSVCLDDLTLKSTTVLPCRHGFHYSCIDTWVDDHRKYRCPVCRQTFVIHIMLRHLWEEVQVYSVLGAMWIVLDMGIII